MSARLLLGGQLTALRGMAWHVVCGDAYDDAPADLVVHHVPMQRELARSDLASFVRLVRLFHRQRFRFVQTHTPKASMLALPAARLTRTPSIYTIHGAMYFRGNRRRSNILGWAFEKWCCSWADQVLVQSAEDRRSLPAARVCPDRKLSYLGNGIVLSRFAEPVEPALPPGKPVVLMISRLVVEKGCLDFFQLSKQLRTEASFVHVGPEQPDQWDGITAQQIEQAKVDGVTFVGEVADVRPYIESASVVVLPSRREGIPRAVMEAAAMGRAVVAYDIRGVREVIPLGDLLVPVGDVDGLARRVHEIVVDPQRRTVVAEACRRHVLTGFGEHHVVERLRRVYADLGW